MAPSATLNLARVGDKLVKRAKRFRVTSATLTNTRGLATRNAHERAEDLWFFGYRLPIWMDTMTNERNRADLEDGFPAGIDHTDALLDEALRETFPASDPIAISAPKGDAVATAARTPAESTIYDSESVFVEQLLPAARARLVTIARDAPLREVARLLRAGTDLIVVCGSGGVAVGVITKTDVVARLSECQGTACTIAAALVMSTDILQCTPGDLVQDVWSKMKSRGLKNILVTGTDGRPVGVLNVRDALGALLREVKGEESLLRDYVMGVGYR